MGWKYKVITLSDDAQVNAKDLSNLGSAGWELVAVDGNETGKFAYLKLDADKVSHAPIRLGGSLIGASVRPEFAVRITVTWEGNDRARLA